MTYGSFDYTSLLYLSDYSEDFGGGRFVFMDADSNKTVEPRAGTSPGWLQGAGQAVPFTGGVGLCFVSAGITWGSVAVCA